MSRRIQITIGGGFALLLLWLFLRESDAGNVFAEIKRADYRWVLAATTLTVLAVVHRAWRWHYLLLPIKSISLAPLPTSSRASSSSISIVLDRKCPLMAGIEQKVQGLSQPSEILTSP